MPTTRGRLRVGWSSASSRHALSVTLGLGEGGVAAIRRDTGRLLGRAEMHLRAWREALDPDTHEWAAKARLMAADRTPEEIRADLQNRIGRARRQS